MKKLDYTFSATLEHMALVKIATVLWNHDDIRNCLTSEIFSSNSCGDEVDESFTFCNRILGHIRGFNKTLIWWRSLNPFDTRSKVMSAWQKIENIVLEKVLRLLLSNSQKEKVISCIKPIGLEILKWLENHVKAEYLAISLPGEFCWTSHGTIDMKKTAAGLIDDEKIDIIKRYKLACIYCLENDVKVLRDKILKHHTLCDLEDCYVCEEFLKFSDDGDASEVSFEYSELVYIWDCILSGKTSDLPQEYYGNACTPFQYAFEHAAEYGHKAATEYFFQKLTPAERKESLVRLLDFVPLNREQDDAFDHSFSVKDHGDVLRFLLSQMDEQLLLEVFKKSSSLGRRLLECCLDWPWQGFFLETARFVQEFLRIDESVDDNENTLFVLIIKTLNGFKDCDYQKLFREFFLLIPKTHKTYFRIESWGVASEFPSSLLAGLFGIKDRENISLILKDATAEEKDKIIFFKKSKHICLQLAYYNEFDLLEFFLTECIASQDKVIQFREEITKYASDAEGKTAVGKKLCLQVLDSLIQKERW